ncbi:helix-turn-helix domain-containing protein [Lacticaseibacillus rhamnosus]|uniref:helix-turn-helix domain-containing protein n=1 Tax=Lacticaseibacillus rhamnosus TaxID=47715 RepID=UPI001112637A|nr:helix-turn-helix transcriptional regulator [Lacticaseibacillus rhamnosus]WBF77181.1 hypothetical protein [Lacticaseibacillus phage R10.1]
MKLKQARVRSGMSQEELANRVHLSVSMIQSIENGRRDGSTKTLIALAAALNTTPNDLLYGIDNTISTSKHIPAQREEVTR